MTSTLRRQEVEKVTGLSRSTIYSQMKEGVFPKPVKIGKRSVGWLEEEILDWRRGKITKRDGVAA